MSELLFQPLGRTLGIIQEMSVRLIRTRDHHNGNAEPARRRDLRIGCRTSRIFGDKQVDLLVHEECHFGLLVEGTPIEYQPDIARQHDTVRRIDHACDIVMARTGGEGAEFETAETEKNPARLRSERIGSRFRACDRQPCVARLGLPGRPHDRGERDRKPLTGGQGIGRDLICIGVRRVDDGRYGFLFQPRGQSVSAPEAANSGAHRLHPWLRNASGQRERRLKAGVGCKQMRQAGGFCRTSEDENAHWGLFRDD